MHFSSLGAAAFSLQPAAPAGPSRGQHLLNRPIFPLAAALLAALWIAGIGNLALWRSMADLPEVANARGLAFGIGFGVAGDRHVRFALVENEQRIRQATRGIKRALRA